MEANITQSVHQHEKFIAQVIQGVATADAFLEAHMEELRQALAPLEARLVAAFDGEPKKGAAAAAAPVVGSVFGNKLTSTTSDASSADVTVQVEGEPKPKTESAPSPAPSEQKASRTISIEAAGAPGAPAHRARGGRPPPAATAPAAAPHALQLAARSTH